MKPDFKIIAENTDITAKIEKRLVSLTLSDENGITSDSVKINLDDSGHQLKIPKKGVKLTVSIGYKNNLVNKGSFNVDTVDLSEPPPRMNITARGANFSKALREPKTRSWHGKTFYDILKTVAGNHNLQAKISETLQSKLINHIDQTDESDIHFLTRLAKEYDAVVKPNGTFLMLLQNAEAKTVSGRALPEIAISFNKIASWSGSLPDRNKFLSACAVWIDREAGEEKKVTIGDGKPVWTLRKKYKDENEAAEAAQAALKKLNRKNAKLSFTMPGNAEVCAESPLILSGFREDFNGKWIVKKTTHTINNSGFKTSVECEPARN